MSYFQSAETAPERSSTSAVRASISFPPEIYRTLEDIARRKKVSLAWVVREAAEKYVADQWPLFGSAGPNV
jgi:predicted DNA-binding ribbon-helix-helix protein